MNRRAASQNGMMELTLMNFKLGSPQLQGLFDDELLREGEGKVPGPGSAPVSGWTARGEKEEG